MLILGDPDQFEEHSKSHESCEIPENTPYFMVGLSGGITENEGESFSLPIDFLRYLDYLAAQNGYIVLFDANPSWQKAASQMQIRIESILKASGMSNIQIAKASDLITPKQGKFNQIFKFTKSQIIADPALAEKTWQIVPPSAKGNFPPDSKYASFDDFSKLRAIKLMEYEIFHIAFILTCKGTKILHGRSEERSKQIATVIAERLDLKTKPNIANPPDLRVQRLSPSKYPNPYALSQSHSPQDLDKITFQRGQFPIRASFAIAQAMQEFVATGQKQALKDYLLKNLQHTQLAPVIESLNFDNSQELYQLAALISYFVAWPIEEQELLATRSDNKILLKIHEILYNFSLSPKLKVIIEDLMPTMYGTPPTENTQDLLKWWIEGLDGEVGPIAALNEQERDLIQVPLTILKRLYVISGGEESELTASDWWQRTVEIDVRLNGGAFVENQLCEGKIYDNESKKTAALERLKAAVAGTTLENEESSSTFHLKWGMLGIPGLHKGVSQKAREYVFKKIIIPCLIKKGNQLAQTVHSLGGDNKNGPIVFSMFFDDLIEEYTNHRAKDLGLSEPDKARLTAKHWERHGLLQKGGAWAEIGNTLKEIADAVEALTASH